MAGGNGQEDVRIITPEIVAAAGEGANSMGDLIAAGRTVEQLRSKYHTAVRVQVERDLDRVRAELLREAEFAGGSFTYSFPVKSRDGSRSLIEGESIDLINSAVNAWGNCTLEVYEVEGSRTARGVTFVGVFLDLQKGVTKMRPFSLEFGSGALLGVQEKESQKARQRMALEQAAISRCARNVGKAGLPKWLLDEARRADREACASKLSGEKLLKAIDDAVIYFKQTYGVVKEQLEAALDKPKDVWVADDVVRLRGMVKAIEDGHAKVSELFPELEVKQPATTPPKEEPKPQPKPEPAPATTPPAPTTANTEPKELNDSQGDMLNEIAEAVNQLAGKDPRKISYYLRQWTDNKVGMITELAKHPELFDTALDRARISLDEARNATPEKPKDKGKLL